MGRSVKQTHVGRGFQCSTPVASTLHIVQERKHSVSMCYTGQSWGNVSARQRRDTRCISVVAAVVVGTAIAS